METVRPAAVGNPIATIRDLVPSIDESRMARAIAIAKDWYKDQQMELMPDVSLYEHAVRTAMFLAEFCHDEDAIIACVLQHALRAGISPVEIGREFGRPVRDIVSRVHLLSHLYTTDWRKSIDDMKIMLVSVADDVRVLLTILSVACTLMEMLQEVRPEHRMRLCRQSLQLFAPVASRLGIYALKYRLEKSAFPECYPIDAQHIHRQLALLHQEHGQFINQCAGELRDFLQKEGITAEVMAREKQPYSIFQKMHTKSVTSLEKITDLFAIRVVVPTLPDCYQTLGLLHRLGTPISHRFKDYISFPKPNGYQSLHTSLIGLPSVPKDVMVEIQIRTVDMHREAEYGVAAHWLYKEGSKNSVLQSVRQLHLSDIILKQQAVGMDTGKAGENITLVDHMYVLTPRGDIIELPDGGTPLDFAFAVHTDIGLKFKSARVNGAIVPVSYRLENGDVVEIQTHKYPRPTLQWLEVLVTPSARSRLKAYFFSHNRAQFLLKGRDLINAELKLRGQAPLDTELSIFAKFDGKSCSMKEREDLVVKVGMNAVRTSSVLRHAPTRVAPRPEKQPQRATKVMQKRTNAISLDGEPLTMPHRFAKCCSPHSSEPRPEKLLGVVSRGGTIVVHRDSCGMAKGADPKRKLKMLWA